LRPTWSSPISPSDIRRYQIKIGNDPIYDARGARTIIEAFPEIFFFVDANAGYTLLEAQIAMRELEDTNLYFEHPCRDLTACAILRKSSGLPMVMDESVVIPAAPRPRRAFLVCG
jgi:L-alanine-DL-glutamate epimerase-like enolase superfamily enzyme